MPSVSAANALVEQQRRMNRNVRTLIVVSTVGLPLHTVQKQCGDIMEC